VPRVTVVIDRQRERVCAACCKPYPVAEQCEIEGYLSRRAWRALSSGTADDGKVVQELRILHDEVMDAYNAARPGSLHWSAEMQACPLCGNLSGSDTREIRAEGLVALGAATLAVTLFLFGPSWLAALAGVASVFAVIAGLRFVRHVTAHGWRNAVSPHQHSLSRRERRATRAAFVGALLVGGAVMLSRYSNEDWVGGACIIGIGFVALAALGAFRRRDMAAKSLSATPDSRATGTTELGEEHDGATRDAPASPVRNVEVLRKPPTQGGPDRGGDNAG
jgi:hypothetical protein